MRIVTGMLALLLVMAGCSEQEAEPEAPAARSSPAVDQDLRDAAEGLAEEQPGYGESHPDCTKVWKVGKRLPEGYLGCMEAGRLVPRSATPCVNGKDLVSFGDLWAIGRQPIRRGPLTGNAYLRTYASCIGR